MQDYSQQHNNNRMDDHQMIYSQGRDPNGIIMVESNPHSAYKQQVESATAAASNGKKKNKKKNKNKIGGDDASSKSNQMQAVGGMSGERMVRIFMIRNSKVIKK
jgi:hypothetical protein